MVDERLIKNAVSFLTNKNVQGNKASLGPVGASDLDAAVGFLRAWLDDAPQPGTDASARPGNYQGDGWQRWAEGLLSSLQGEAETQADAVATLNLRVDAISGMEENTATKVLNRRVDQIRDGIFNRSARIDRSLGGLRESVDELGAAVIVNRDRLPAMDDTLAILNKNMSDLSLRVETLAGKGGQVDQLWRGLGDCLAKLGAKDSRWETLKASIRTLGQNRARIDAEVTNLREDQAKHRRVVDDKFEDAWKALTKHLSELGVLRGKLQRRGGRKMPSGDKVPSREALAGSVTDIEASLDRVWCEMAAIKRGAEDE